MKKKRPRINLVETIQFHHLPCQIQFDLRNCVKLKNNQYIDFRSKQIQDLCIQNGKLRKMNMKHDGDKATSVLSNNDSLNSSTEWVIGIRPKQKETIKQLRKEIVDCKISLL